MVKCGLEKWDRISVVVMFLLSVVGLGLLWGGGSWFVFKATEGSNSTTYLFNLSFQVVINSTGATVSVTKCSVIDQAMGTNCNTSGDC
jgi:hypothetical protein